MTLLFGQRNVFLRRRFCCAVACGFVGGCCITFAYHIKWVVLGSGWLLGYMTDICCLLWCQFRKLRKINWFWVLFNMVSSILGNLMMWLHEFRTLSRVIQFCVISIRKVTVQLWVRIVMVYSCRFGCSSDFDFAYCVYSAFGLWRCRAPRLSRPPLVPQLPTRPEPEVLIGHKTGWRTIRETDLLAWSGSGLPSSPRSMPPEPDEFARLILWRGVQCMKPSFWFARSLPWMVKAENVHMCDLCLEDGLTGY